MFLLYTKAPKCRQRCNCVILLHTLNLKDVLESWTKIIADYGTSVCKQRITVQFYFIWDMCHILQIVLCCLFISIFLPIVFPLRYVCKRAFDLLHERFDAKRDDRRRWASPLILSSDNRITVAYFKDVFHYLKVKWIRCQVEGLTDTKWNFNQD